MTRLTSPLPLKDMEREEHSAEGEFALIRPKDVAVKLEAASTEDGVDSGPSARAHDRPKARRPTPELKLLSSWLEEPDIGVQWRVDGWIPGTGRILVAAQAKAGKTTLTGNIIRSLVDGVPFLGDEDATATPLAEGETVVLLDFEMTPQQMKDWLRRQGIRRTTAVFVAPMRGYASSFTILVTSKRQEWAETLRRLHCKVLGIDCLRPILDSLALDESSEAGQFLVALDELLTEAGIDVCWLVHHWGHAKKRPRGDSRLRDWPDAEISLIRRGEHYDSPRFISARGRDVDQPERPLIYDAETRHLTFRDGGGRMAGTPPVKDAAPSTTEAVLQKIVKLLSDEPGLSGSDVTKRLREHSKHSKDTIAAALSLGCVTKILRGEGPKNHRRYFVAVPEAEAH